MTMDRRLYLEVPGPVRVRDESSWCVEFDHPILNLAQFANRYIVAVASSLAQACGSDAVPGGRAQPDDPMQCHLAPAGIPKGRDSARRIQ